jgi:hypothetical protein
MDMLETYLEAVAAQLPRDTSDDIAAELRDTLLSQFEDREEALGRPLTDDEREEMLRAMGHPLVVAARYRKGPQLLIGPELFPYWLFAVKAGLLILAAAFALTLIIGLASSPLDGGRTIAHAFQGWLGAGLTLIGAVTLAGAIFEHFGLRPPYLDNWRVRDLQLFRLGDPASWAAQIGAEMPRRTGAPPKGPRAWPGSEALLSLVAGLVFAAWWVGLLHFPGLGRFARNGSEVLVEAAPIWAALFLPILAYVLVQAAVDALGVVRPAAIRLRAALQIPVAIAGIVLTWMVLQAGHWLTLVRGGERAAIGGDTSLLGIHGLSRLGAIDETVAGLATALSVIATWVLAITLVGLGLKILKSLWQIFAAGRRVAG